MTDEQPVVLKKRKTLANEQAKGLVCIVHYDHHDKSEEVKPLTSSTFGTILNCIRPTVHQSQSSSSSRLDAICSRIPKTYDESCHGCHRWCYQSFTNVSKLKRKLADDTNNQGNKLTDTSEPISDV